MKTAMAAAAIALAVSAAALAADPQARQARPGSARGRSAAESIPRTRDGKPNLEGHYQPDFRGGAPNNNIEQHPASFLRPGGKSIVVDPPDGKIPYQPWAFEERDWRRRPENSYNDPEGHCFPSGVPRQMYISGGGGVFQILQPPGTVVFLFEYIHAYRVVPLDGRPHISDAIRLWEGDSVGRWDGDTLVIDTTNNNGKTWFELSGNFTSDAAHQVERMTMVDANTIDYDATIDDPTVFTRPWKLALGWKRVTDKPFQEILEQACHEGNLDLAHMRGVKR